MANSPELHSQGQTGLLRKLGRFFSNALNALNITQLREFCNLTGFGFSKAREMEFSGEITAANYLAVGALLRVTKQIVDNAPGFRG